MRAWLLRFVVWATAATAWAESAESQVPESAEPAQARYRSWRSGEWLVQQSESFRVLSRLSADRTGELAPLCEHLRSTLQRTWFGESDRPWTPLCDVVVWRTVEEYGRAVGRPGDRSVGCATVDVDGERIVRRRIDLRADAPDWWRSALPHEMTHVVFADRFAGRPLPPWADEGISVLSEPAEKRAQRAAALQRARRLNADYSLTELLAIRTPPPPSHRDAFYGESAALVGLLASRRTPADFVTFLDKLQAEGFDAAVRDVYGIADLPRICGERLQTARLSTDEWPIGKVRGNDAEVPPAAQGNDRLAAAVPE